MVGHQAHEFISKKNDSFTTFKGVCYNCQKHGHRSYECNLKTKPKWKSET